MKWIHVSDRLPKNNTYVLILLNITNWIEQDDPDNVYCRVAKFERGRTKEQLDKLEELGCWSVTARDQEGNNKMPYHWEEFGPAQYFGQQVSYWMPLPELPGDRTGGTR